MKDKIEEIDEYMGMIGYEPMAVKLMKKSKKIKEAIDKLDVIDEVREFYNCEAEERAINGKVFSPPAGYQPVNRKLKKLGLPEYSEFREYSREERNEMVLNFFAEWLEHVGFSKLKDLRERYERMEKGLTRKDSFTEMGKEYKELKGRLDELEEDVRELHGKVF